MWTRRDLKERAKGLFKANYWKAVLVALLLSFVVGCTSSAGSGFSALPALSSGMSSAGTAGSVYSQLEGQGFDPEEFLESGGDLSTIPGLREAMESQEGLPVVAVLAMTGMILVIALIIIAVAILIDHSPLSNLCVDIFRRAA